MGIYVFRYDVLKNMLESNDHADFGHDVLPEMVKSSDVRSFLFRGYWEDIGTMRAFYESSLDLARPDPPFVFHTEGAPIYTEPRFLGATRFESCRVIDSMICDGCYLHGSSITESVVGIRTIISREAKVHRSLIMGADGYEGDIPRQPGDPPLGIGPGCNIEGAIVDKNARIGAGVRITPKEPGTHEDHPYYFVRDGIVVIPKNYAVPSGVEI
jgi:glucose-1-phosphate adenylyltransferase